MKVELFTWTIKDLIENKDSINPKPQYQRTSVWSLKKKQLLIDSILRGYDLPKFFLTATTKNPHFDFEVTDGQQRMRAIWEFASEEEEENYVLAEANIDKENILNKSFNSLNKKLRERFLNYELHFTVIKSSTSEEVRTLFARLQMGERLNSVELRHAIPSNIGNLIFLMTENHSFFKGCGISNKRYKHQDYLDHVLALAYYKTGQDIKAPDLRKFYNDLATIKISDFQPQLRKASKILELMELINNHKKGIFRNKWAFVDTFYLLFENSDLIQDIKAKDFAESFQKFEKIRKTYNRNPEDLIEDKESLNYDKDMYDYILAFNSGGGLKRNIKIRHRVFTNKFLNSTNFKIKKDASTGKTS